MNDLKLTSLVVDHSAKRVDHTFKVYDCIQFAGKFGIIIGVEWDSVKIVN